MKILGHEYTVTQDKLMMDERRSVGTCCPATLTIKVYANSPKSRKEEALLHEIFEAIAYHLDIENKEFDHQVLSSISEAFYQVIKDNPGYFTIKI